MQRVEFIYGYAECHYAQCRILFIVMLNVVMLSVVMQSRYAECSILSTIKLSVIMSSVVMLIALAPLFSIFWLPKTFVKIGLRNNPKFRQYYTFLLKLFTNNMVHLSQGEHFACFFANRTAHIRHQCMKTTVFSCHRCLIYTVVEKMNNI